MAALDWVSKSFIGALNTFEEGVVLIVLPSSGLLVRMVLENLLSGSDFDLFIRSLVTVFRKSKNGIVVLTLCECKLDTQRGTRTHKGTNPPVLGITGEHQWVLRLTYLTRLIVFDLLGFGLSLDAFIFRKRATMPFAASIGQEVWANRLNLAHDRWRQCADSFEVWVFFTSSNPILG